MFEQRRANEKLRKLIVEEVGVVEVEGGWAVAGWELSLLGVLKCRIEAVTGLAKAGVHEAKY